MATGIVIERTPSGIAAFAHINLRKYGDELRPFFKEKGVELDEVNFTPKLRQAMWEADNKIGKIGDINNFWDD